MEFQVVYSLMNNDNNESIHENNFVKIPTTWQNDKLNKKWESLYQIKQEANIAIEEKRSKKIIGSSLEATLIVKLNNENQKFLKNIDLSELCITSSVKIENVDTDEVIVETIKATGEKCPVCWKISSKPCERHKL